MTRYRSSVDPQRVTIVDHPDRLRYEARDGAELAGFVDYRRIGGRLVLVHTEVLPAFEGRGVGSALARSILDEARAMGVRVTVKCPFIRTWVERHPEYASTTTPTPGRANLPGS